MSAANQMAAQKPRPSQLTINDEIMVRIGELQDDIKIVEARLEYSGLTDLEIDGYRRLRNLLRDSVIALEAHLA